MHQPGRDPRVRRRVNTNTRADFQTKSSRVFASIGYTWHQLANTLNPTKSTLFCGKAVLVIALLLIPGSVLLTGFNSPVAHAATAGTAKTLNFQARLLNTSGNLVPDGYYNIEFKLYDVPSAGSALWTETRYDTNGVTAGNDFRVRVVNGYFSVNLGDTDPAVGGSALTGIDWSQQLWLTMNIGGSTQTATPTYDGEMTPRITMTAIPLAFMANNVNSGNTTAASTSSANTLLQSGNTTGATSNSGTVTLQSGNVTNGNSGNILIDAGSASGTKGTISVGTANASAITIGRTGVTTTNAGALTVTQTLTANGDIVVAAGKSLTITGSGTRPGSPTEGMVYFDTTTKQLLVYANGKWQADRSTATKIVAASNSTQAAKDVADYVADGNTGSANDGDQVEINAALTAAAGGKVYLMEGTYVVDATILIPNTTTLAGAGFGTNIELADLDTAVNLIENSTTIYYTGAAIVIRDLRIDGRDDLNTAGTQNGIYFNQMDTGIGGIINNVWAKDFRNVGIAVNESGFTTVTNSTATGNGTGISVSGDKLNSVSGNVVHDNVTGIYVSSTGSTVNNNIVYLNSYGITTDLATNTIVTNNTLNGNTTYGIYISAAYGGGVISSNRITESGGSTTNNGIYVGSADNNSIINNDISDGSCSTNCYAINISTSAADTNYISGNRLNGSSIADAGNNGTIYETQLTAAGILQSGSSYIKSSYNSNLTGTGAIAATTALTGTSTKFTTELQVGDRVTVNTETRTVTVITSDTSVTVDMAFTTTVSGQTITRLPAALRVTNSAGVNQLLVQDNGAVITTGTLVVQGASITSGTASQAGSYILSDGSSSTITFKSATQVAATNYDITVPAITGNDTICLQTFANCGGGSGVTTMAAIGSTPNANGASIAGVTLTLQPADGSFGGVVTTAAQTFAGVKTFNDNIVLVAAASLKVTGDITANRPSSPTEGQVWFDTTTKQLITYSNGKWQGDRSTATKIVAASNSSQAAKDSADYVTTGTADQTIINNALTAAAGGKVYLMEGTYYVADSISVPDNTVFAGAGKGTQIQFVNLSGASKSMIVATAQYPTGLVIRDLYLNGRKDINVTGVQNGIKPDSLAHGLIEGVKLSNFSGSGIKLDYASVVTVTGNTVDNSDTGIDTYLANFGGQTVNLIGNNAYSNTYGFNINSTTVATGNGASNNTNGFYIHAGLVTGNTANGNTTGFSLTQYGPATVTGNTADSNGAGIYIGEFSNSTISQNTLTNNTSYAINATVNSSNNVISGNAISNSGGSTANNAISLSGTGDHVTDNTINDSSCTTTCVAILVGGTANYLSGNTYKGSVANAATISDTGTGTIFASQLTPAQILQSGSSLIKANASSSLTGTGAIAATTALTGTSTKFTTQLQVGDRVTVNSETRFVTVITSDTSVTVSTAFTTTASAQTITRLPAALLVQNSSGTNTVRINDIGAATFRNSTDSANAFSVLNSSGTSYLNVDTSAGVVTLGSTVAGATSTIQAGSAGGINIGNNVGDFTVQIGSSNSYSNQVINIGNNISNISNTLVTIGSIYNGSSTTIQAAHGGALNLANNVGDLTVQIGSSNSVSYQTIKIGDNSNILAETYLTLGSSKNASSTTINAGSAGLLLKPASSNVLIGTSDTTGTLLVVDTKTGAGDPTGVNGGIYYNSNANKFRCYENSAWADCVSTGSGVTTMAAIGSTPNANGASIAGVTLTLQPADGSFGGVVTTAAQTFAGVKTFNDNIVLVAAASLKVTGDITANRPSSPTEGQVWFDTTTKQLITYSNGKWQGDRSTATKIVAPSTAAQAVRDAADYITDGTGDQVEINAALTAASGGKVYLVEGTYVANATILIPNNTALAGAGRGTLIELADLDATENLIENSDAATGTGVVIRDMRIDGRDDLNTAGTQYGIYLNNMGGGSGSGARQGGLIEGIWIEDFRTANIHLYSSNNNLVNNNVSQGGTADGILLTASTYNTVNGNLVQGNGGSGVKLSLSSNNTITGNIAQGNNEGMTIRDSSSYNTISGNNMNANTLVGIQSALSARYLSITGNTITGNGTYGIYINENYNQISGNKLHDNGGASTNNAIYLTAADNNTITGNDITDTSCGGGSCYAINIFNGTSDNNYISGNRYTGDGTNVAIINDAGTGTIYASQLTPAQVLQSGSSLIKANASSTLSGTGAIAATTALTGTSTKFTTELQVGDRVTINGETRFVTVITSDTAVVVDTAFTTIASTQTITRLPVALIVQNSTGANILTVSNSVTYLGNGINNAAPTSYSLQGTGSTTAGTAGAALMLLGGAGATTTTGSAGGAVTIQGGNAGGSNANAGGAVTLQGGTPSATGAGGVVSILAGAGGSSSGNGGAIAVTAGSGTAGNSLGGAVTITAGNGIGTGGNGGSITLQAGTSGNNAANGGSISLLTGAGSAGGNSSGSISLATANTTSNSGNITQSTGTGQYSGSISLNTGAATTTAGAITLQPGSSGNSNGAAINLISGTGGAGYYSGDLLFSTSAGNGTGSISLTTGAGNITGGITLGTGNGTTSAGGITIQTGTSSNTNGAAVNISAGQGAAGGFIGGALNITAGVGGSTGAGGAILIQGGTGGSISGSGGAVTLQAGASAGTNIAGGLTTIAGGKGTGTGVGGNLVFQTAKAGLTGSGVNSLQTVLTLSGTNGSALLQNSVDSNAAFQVQGTADTLFTADTTLNKLVVGNATGTNASTTLLVLDSATADPATGYAGAMYYNSSTFKFRCYQNGAWVDCIGAGGGGGDNITVNGTAATDANFINTAGSASVAGTTFGIAGSGPSSVTMTVADASATASGVVTGNAQTFGGAKTYNGEVLLTTVSGAGLASCSNATTSKLLYDSTAKTFSCGTDQGGAGGGVSAIGAIDTTPTSANGARISGSSLYMQYADATYPGLVSATTQTFAGDKTFTGTLLQKSDSASALTLQDSTGTYNNLSFDSTTNRLRVYNHGGTRTAYLEMYYDNATSTGIIASSSGTTQIGSGAGSGGDINLLLTNETDKLSATKSGTLTGAYTASDFNFTRNLTIGSYAANGNIVKIEDTTGIGTGSIAANVLYLNQGNTSATGNLILARTGGATDVFKVSTAGVVTLSAGGSYTGAGAIIVSSGAATALTLTGNAASTWSTTTGNITIQAGGANAVIIKPGTDSTSAFAVQDAAGTAMFTADSTNDRLTIGVSDTVGTILILDTKTTTGDPTGVNGAMYYNSFDNRFKCYENSAWKECNHRTVVRLTADVINSNAVANTMADVTGLSWVVTSGTYYNFSCNISYNVALTTTGSRWGMNGPAAPTAMNYRSEVTTAAATITINSGNIAYDTPAASSTSSGFGSSNNIAILTGFIKPSANGTVVVRFASELASTPVTAKAGSTCEWW